MECIEEIWETWSSQQGIKNSCYSEFTNKRWWMKKEGNLMKNETSSSVNMLWLMDQQQLCHQKLLSFSESRMKQRGTTNWRARSKHHLSRRFTTKSAKTSSSQELIEDVVDDQKTLHSVEESSGHFLLIMFIQKLAKIKKLKKSINPKIR